MANLETFEVGGVKFKTQTGLSFMQKNQISVILGSHLDLKEVNKLKRNTDGSINVEDVPESALKGSPLEITNALEVFVLLNVVKEPKITMEMLEDPDNEDAPAYSAVAKTLLKFVMEDVKNDADLKKTLIKLPE